MKIIHCADIHLDSAMKKNLSKEQSLQRRSEILLTFESMIDYARENDVRAVLIAGDLFDTNVVSRKTGSIILNQIRQAPEIDFYYLRGNHDSYDFFTSGEQEEVLPDNLKLFLDRFVTYSYPGVTISGAELTGENQDTIYQSLVLEPQNFNIVMLHGQDSLYQSKDNAQVIAMNQLKNRFIDYLALGHLHTYKEGPLDNRGSFCYPGCLEGRGFDECGQKGFVLLTILDGRMTKEFIPAARRSLHELTVDVTGCDSTFDVAQLIGRSVERIDSQDLVQVILTGEVGIDSERNLSYLTEKFSQQFYVFQIKDKTRFAVKQEDYLNDVTLKGEFIRLCMEKSYDEEKRKAVMELGIHALMGEEL
ncbi:MAG: exonuclease SbcCD subunit D [Lachnospiraceae bacterium]